MKQDICVGVIPDTHFPFCHPNFLEFCKKIFKELGVNKVIHIGDIVDHYIISNHDSDRRGLSANVELELAIRELKKWYEAFPEVTVCKGNHDERIEKAGAKFNLPNKYFRPLNEIYEFPESWSFVDSVEVDNVKYVHGTGTMDAYRRCILEGKSIVQGHLHTKCGVQYFNRDSGRIFGMQVGCAVDNNSIGMSYARNNSLKPIIGVGIIKNGNPINILMPSDF